MAENLNDPYILIYFLGIWLFLNVSFLDVIVFTESRQLATIPGILKRADFLFLVHYYASGLSHILRQKVLISSYKSLLFYGRMFIIASLCAKT